MNGITPPKMVVRQRNKQPYFWLTLSGYGKIWWFYVCFSQSITWRTTQLFSWVDALLDAFPMKASTCDLIVLGGRIRLARESSGLSRPAFVERFGGSVRTLENAEGGRNEPGACLIAAFANLGINTAWILTGDGPMRLADLQAHREVSEPINTGALAALIRGAIAVVEGGMSVDRAAKMAADMYSQLRDEGQITPTGIGEGSAGKAA